jgi:hypothetical protein
MPCERYVSPDGKLVAIICSRGRRSVILCHYCGKPHTSLCDYPLANGKTCDRPMCNSCKTRIGPDLDVCQEHNNHQDVITTQRGRDCT